MARSNCENCAMRAKYDRAPDSFLGRFWKWHTRFCPGWKSYLIAQTRETREELFRRYGVRRL
ncbi:MAG TPA: hypothetical protein PKO25_08920 [Spirochaetota bacterium]|nr:hypothetical protein [Spirochaetota bacterium]OPZ37386.1 MAG: hypothetical protein BWY96_01725 [Spirochaetes bacterium ADurb.BinA120]HNU91981.1 hypothetical protein [Spirochaetota bacterium]HPI13398.1 hypothetical protein [Spirochaetota bacterium]HPO46462.1 hypothetical protein [Spirochaetota bacterium]